MPRTLTGNSPRREQRLQELLFARMAQQFERRLALEIARAMRSAAKALADGAVSPGDSIRAEHRRRVSRLLDTIWRQSATAMAEHMRGAQRAWSGRMEVKQATEIIIDRLMADWIATIGAKKISQITATTAEDIRRIIERGAREGLSEAEIGKMIRDVAPSKAAGRAALIARTEVHSVSQAAAQTVAEDSGLEMRREWVSARGERTRSIAEGAQFDHAAANGQKVAMDEPFVIEGVRGSEQLMFPGDPNGSAANIINCRCVVVYELE